MTATNALAYYGAAFITVAKSFIELAKSAFPFKTSWPLVWQGGALHCTARHYLVTNRHPDMTSLDSREF